jgi:ribonuclease HI
MSEVAAVGWIDGGSRGNPGPAGCGIVIELSDGRRETHTLFVGTTTNNVAEYAALLALLERAAALGVTRLEARSDSELLVKQLNGEYRVKASHLQPLWLRAAELRRGFTRFAISHVRRTANVEADRLANRAMDEKASTLPKPRGMR